MRCALYLRQSSTSGEGEDSLSLDSQDSILRDDAKRDGDTIVAVFRDADLKGWQDETERPGIAEALALAKAKGYERLRFYDLSRFARSVRIQEALIYQLNQVGVEIISHREPWVGTPLFRQILGAIAEEQTRTIAAHTRRAHRERANRGLWVAKPPYGYCRPDAKLPLVIVEAQAAIVLEIARQYVAGASVIAIALDLNRRGLPSPGGGLWTETAIRRALDSRVYRGEVVYHGEWLPGGHPPIGDAALWDTVADNRTRRGRTPRHKAEPSWLEGLVEHACGAPMYLVPPPGGGRDRQFRCRLVTRPDLGECAIRPRLIGASRLEAAARTLLVRFFAKRVTPEQALARAQREHRQQAPLAERRRHDLAEQRQRLQSRRQRAEELYLSGSRDRPWFDAQDAQISGELAGLDTAIAALPAAVDQGKVLDFGERLLTVAQIIRFAELADLAAALRLLGVIVVDAGEVRLDIRSDAARPHLRAVSLAVPITRR